VFSVARRIFAGLSAGTQTQPRGLLASDSGRFVSYAPHRFRGLRREKAASPLPTLHRQQWRSISGHRRFQPYVAINGLRRPRPLPSVKRRSPWSRLAPEQSPPPHANHDWALSFRQAGASSSKGKAKAKAPPPKKERAGSISRWRSCRPYTTRTSPWACATSTFPVAGTSTPGGCRSLRCLAAACGHQASAGHPSTGSARGTRLR
jgi:hypothetical protein